MHVALIRIRVKPEHVEAFVRETHKNHAGSVAEPGNLRFDVLRSEADPARFVLIEVYRTPEDAAAHKATPHYRAWREAVRDWMAAPREGENYRAIAPAGPEAWAMRR
jgi:(4S)-4-hydroxy-5-phosphonooxypentane-2,3-dione isomerase